MFNSRLEGHENSTKIVETILNCWRQYGLAHNLTTKLSQKTEVLLKDRRDLKTNRNLKKNWTEKIAERTENYNQRLV